MKEEDREKCKKISAYSVIGFLNSRKVLRNVLEF